MMCHVGSPNSYLYMQQNPGTHKIWGLQLRNASQNPHPTCNFLMSLEGVELPKQGTRGSQQMVICQWNRPSGRPAGPRRVLRKKGDFEQEGAGTQNFRAAGHVGTGSRYVVTEEKSGTHEVWRRERRNAVLWSGKRRIAVRGSEGGGNEMHGGKAAVEGHVLDWERKGTRNGER